MKKLMLTMAVMLMAAGAQADETRLFRPCASDTQGALGAVATAAMLSGGSLGRIVSLAIDALPARLQCTKDEGADVPSVQPEQPGQVHMNPAGTIGGTYMCPTYMPYLHCNVLGSCYCSQFP